MPEAVEAQHKLLGHSSEDEKQAKQFVRSWPVLTRRHIRAAACCRCTLGVECWLGKFHKYVGRQLLERSWYSCCSTQAIEGNMMCHLDWMIWEALLSLLNTVKQLN